MAKVGPLTIEYLNTALKQIMLTGTWRVPNHELYGVAKKSVYTPIC